MKIKITFFCVLMIFTLIFTHSYLSLAALLAAFLHEMGHLAMAKVCRIPIKELKLDIFGAALTPQDDLCSYKSEIALALGGPAVNLISFFALGSFDFAWSGFASLFLISSAFLGILNLLPICDFDGGRILKCLLLLKCSQNTVYNVSCAVSFTILFLLWILSVYLLLIAGASLSLFLFSFALLCKMLALKQ